MEFDNDNPVLISLIAAFIGIYYAQRSAIIYVHLKWMKDIAQKANKDP